MISFKPLLISWALGALDLLSLCLAETMTASVSTSAAIAKTRPKIFDVNVGNEEGALIFEPDTVVASIGEIVNFHFYPINHSVAQSSFEKPCQPLSGGVGQLPIFSGFFPIKSGEASSMFSMTIHSMDPIWLYCSQIYDSHCQAGQVMVINPLLSRFSEGSQTLEGYKANAMNATTSTSPVEVFGGLVMPNVGSYNASSSSGSTSASTATASTSSSAPKKGDGVAGRSVSIMVVVGICFLAGAKVVI